MVVVTPPAKSQKKKAPKKIASPVKAPKAKAKAKGKGKGKKRKGKAAVDDEETEDDDCRIVLSKEKADRLKIWDEISGAYEAYQPVEGKVLSRVKGGLSVDIGVKAFLPGSQVDLRPVRNLESFLG